MKFKTRKQRIEEVMVLYKKVAELNLSSESNKEIRYRLNNFIKTGKYWGGLFNLPDYERVAKMDLYTRVNNPITFVLKKIN